MRYCDTRRLYDWFLLWWSSETFFSKLNCSRIFEEEMSNPLLVCATIFILFLLISCVPAREHHKCNLKFYNLQHGSDKFGRRQLHQYQTMYCEVLHPYLHGDKPRMARHTATSFFCYILVYYNSLLIFNTSLKLDLAVDMLEEADLQGFGRIGLKRMVEA